MPGRLYIVSTPIGNLGDIPPRVSQALADSDFLLVEDTRVTIKLTSHLGLRKRLVSCHDYNEENRAQMLVEAAAENKTVSLVSDAGTPLVSDPGYRIVKKAIELQMEVIPLPGPSAFLLALIASGLPCDRFIFEGFLPDRAGIARERLQELKAERRTMVFYVSPHKLKKTLHMMAEILGDRSFCLARELTKLHEEFVRTTLLDFIDRSRNWEPRGECVVVVAGHNTVAEQASQEAVMEAIQLEMKNGKRLKEIASSVASRFGWRKSDVYKLALDVDEAPAVDEVDVDAQHEDEKHIDDADDVDVDVDVDVDDQEWGEV